jgi:hypothetical protein
MIEGKSENRRGADKEGRSVVAIPSTSGQAGKQKWFGMVTDNYESQSLLLQGTSRKTRRAKSERPRCVAGLLRQVLALERRAQLDDAFERDVDAVAGHDWFSPQIKRARSARRRSISREGQFAVGH